MKKIRQIFLLAAVLIMAGCGKQDNGTETKEEIRTEVFTNLLSEPVKGEVKKQMQDAGLSNVEDFFTWVNDYNGRMKSDAGLVGDWTPLTEQEYAVDLLAKYYDEVGDGTGDSNSRMTAMLLLNDLIEASDRTEYGTYLMMDMDQLEHEAQYEKLKNSLGKYSAVFDEVSVRGIKDVSEFESVFPKAWEERNVTFKEGKASLVSLVLQDPYEEMAFIGHAGVLIEKEDCLLFIEKIAPTEAYQVTRLKDRAELKKRLLEDRRYRAEDEEYEPVCLENNHLMVTK